jgi:hypothetical protein
MVSRPPVVRRFGPAHVAPPASLADAEWSFHREAEVEARPEAFAEQVGAEGRVHHAEANRFGDPQARRRWCAASSMM